MNARVTVMVSLVGLVGCGRTGAPCDATLCPSCCDGSSAVDAGPIVGLALAPDVVWVVDRSSSMAAALEEKPACATNCGVNGRACAPGCQTRWASTRTALADVLRATATVARHAMLIFPSNQQCESSPRFNVAPGTTDDPETMTSRAEDAVRQLELRGPAGGSPQAEALRFVGSVEALRDPRRDHLVVLVTDGLPNCNAQNPNTCNAPTECRCTSPSCQGTNCVIGCLDDVATQTAMQGVAQASQTLVMLGVGPELADPDTQLVFTRVANSGGARRACHDDLDCAPTGRCVTSEGLCASPFWWLRTVDDGPAIAAKLERRLLESALCRFSLQLHPLLPEGAPQQLIVTVGGVPRRLGDSWSLEGTSTVRLWGLACESALGGAAVSFALPN